MEANGRLGDSSVGNLVYWYHHKHRQKMEDESRKGRMIRDSNFSAKIVLIFFRFLSNHQNANGMIFGVTMIGIAAAFALLESNAKDFLP